MERTEVGLHATIQLNNGLCAGEFVRDNTVILKSDSRIQCNFWLHLIPTWEEMYNLK